MALYTIKRFEHRSLLLLFPLLCLALISSGLDSRVPQQFTDEFRFSILLISRLLFPGIFALFATFMIPSNWRPAQMLAVGLSYCLLITFDLTTQRDFYFGATPSVIASLAAALMFLPSERASDRHFRHGLRLIAGGALLAAAVYVLMQTVIRGLDDFIYLTFTKGFVSSTMATFVAPCFTIMQTVGYSAVINSIEALKSVDPHIAAISTAVVLTNIISLPAIMLSRAVFSGQRSRLFLTALGFITIITSQIGVCVSIELAALLMFFPGTFVLLLGSSAILCYFCYLKNAVMLTNIEHLYSPDLIINATDFFHLSASDYQCMLCAAAVPALLIVAVLLVKNSHGMVLESRSTPRRPRTYKVNGRSRPDLVVIALLRACGGLSNLTGVNQEGRELLLTVNDPAQLSLSALSSLCGHRPHLDRARLILSCDLGSNCAVVAQRLTNLLRMDGGAARDHQNAGQTFSIHTYIANRDRLQTAAENSPSS